MAFAAPPTVRPRASRAAPLRSSRRARPRRLFRMALAEHGASTDVPARVAAFLSRAREGRPLAALAAAERAFDLWKAGARQVAQIVREAEGRTRQPGQGVDVDVAVVGGTLGIFFATALQARGVRVAVVERGRLQGRAQEWNVSRPELQSLVREGVLAQAEVDAAIVGEFGPSRVGFVGAPRVRGGPDTAREVAVDGVLNLGVSPAALVAAAARRFERLGGVVLQLRALEEVVVSADEVRLVLRLQRGAAGALGAGGAGLPGEADAGAEPQTLSARLLVDAMGTFSPIAAQARGGARPDGVCVTVGSCVRWPFADNAASDLLYAFRPIDAERGVQHFWEMFPAGRGREYRTTYMFSYGACDPQRQTLAAALDDYLRLLPHYQRVDVDALDVQRVLFAFFPCFRDSPARVAFDRVLPVGDAAGFQSPVSFGGFASCLRHLGRVTAAIDEALAGEGDALLKKEELQRMQFYNPSLSVAWLFNSAMSVNAAKVPRGPLLDNYIVNDLLWANMRAMHRLGPEVQRPFLQDVVTASGLSKALAAMTVQNPFLALKTALFVGPVELLKWTRHFVVLVLFSLAAPVAAALQARCRSMGLSSTQNFRLNRVVDMLRYGSGLDFHG